MVQIADEGSSSLPLVGSKRYLPTYDVFISFRGEDTRKGFTSHLSSALYRKRLDVFVDYRIDKGDEISEALLKAIEGSNVSLVVFSENYATSKWCLDELLHILRCKSTMDQVVIPIFYDVIPSNVRWQKESFAAAFARHEERYEVNMVEKWRSALHDAAGISGHESSKFNTDEEMIEAIVGDTLEKLNTIVGGPNHVPGLVGIGRRVEKVLSLLDIREQDFRVVGIWGMGGIGKTTLAETLFHQIAADFAGSYFFKKVRETEQSGDLIKSRDKALSRILNDKQRIGISRLPNLVIGRLLRTKVLLVLDDVSNQRQLETIFGGLDRLGPGSRVIITTGDRQVLNYFPQDNLKVYSAEGLNNDEALKLFCLNAYTSESQTEAYDELAKRAVGYASGIPLTLKVFARSLRGKEKQVWESALNMFEGVLDLEVRDMLKVSYDGLGNEEIKNIFLDIACFFKGQKKHNVVRLLDGCYKGVIHGLSVLEDKALITMKWNKIEMPDPLQEFGWDIVVKESESPGKRSRLWRVEDVYRVLDTKNDREEDRGTEKVKGIFLDLSKIQEELNLSPDVFKNMYNLRLLKFYSNNGINLKVKLPRGGLTYLPDELRYLCWHGFQQKFLPPSFCQKNLVEIDLSCSNLRRLWSDTQDLCRLKVLKLGSSEKLKKLPDLSRAKHLEIIDLSNTAIKEVPSSFQHLSRLSKLDLRGCSRLKKLPDTLTSLHNLEKLRLDGCKVIKKLPHLGSNIKSVELSGSGVEEVPPSVGSLCKLSHFDLRYCRRLKSLPSDIWKMKSLMELDFTYCCDLEEIPEVLETNEALENIDLSSTPIRALPTSIDRLVELKELRVDGCQNLSALPHTLWNLRNLTHLSMKGTSIREISPSIERLFHLDKLWLGECRNLPHTLWNLENLTLLSFNRTAIGEVPSSIERLARLEKLWFEDCPNVSVLPDTLWNLENLRHLDVRGTTIKELPPFTKDMKNLKHLCISGCDSRDPVPFPVPTLSRVPSLQTLQMRNLCISQIPEDIGDLRILWRLDLSRNGFEVLPASIMNLRKLQKLNLSYCRRLESLPASIKLLSNLEELDVNYCGRLESLPELPSRVWKINAHDCASLTTISGNMEFLAEEYGGKFMFSECISLQEETRTKILAAVKSRFESEEEVIKWRRFVVCLPGRDLPELSIRWEEGSSFTYESPEGLCENGYMDVGICISVEFNDYSPDLGLVIRGECLWEKGEVGYTQESFVYLEAFERRETQTQPKEHNQTKSTVCLGALKREETQTQSMEQKYLRSHHLFLFRFVVPRYNIREGNYKSLTVTFYLLDGQDKPLKNCRVLKCGYFMGS